MLTLYKLSGLETITHFQKIMGTENRVDIPRNDKINERNNLKNIPQAEGKYLHIPNIHITYEDIATQNSNVTQAIKNPLDIPRFHISYQDINGDDSNRLSFKSVCNNTRPNSLLIYKNMWHYVFDGQNMLSVGRAFYDDRSITGKSPVIRIPAVSTYEPFGQYCHVWYKGVDHSFSRPVSHVEKYFLRTVLNDTAYGQAIYTCPLPDVAQLPSHVSLTTSECHSSDASNRNTMMIPVTIPEHPDKFEHEFGVCVTITYNRIIPDQFVEWMEFHHMFGITEFTIYNASVSSEFDHIFQVFIKQTMVHVSQST